MNIPHLPKTLSILYTSMAISILILLIVACSKTHNQSNIARLDSLANKNPGLALKEINQCKKLSIDDLRDRMRIALVKYKAENKAHIVHSSDSTITKIADYFQLHGTIGEQLQCLYYLGCTYRDMHAYSSAIVWYGRVIELAGTNTITHGDSLTLAEAHSQMADILSELGENKEALDQKGESYKMKLLLGAVTVSTLEAMGRYAEAAGERAKAERFYKKALTEIVNQEKDLQYINYLGEQLGFYATSNLWQHAEMLFNTIQRYKNMNLPSKVYASIATYYEKKGLPDSAISYTEKALTLERRPKRKAELAKNLARITAIKGDMAMAYRYSMLSLDFSDLAKAENNAKDVENGKMQRTITELLEARAYKKNAVQRRQLHAAVVIIALLISLSAILLILYISNKRKLKLQADMDKIINDHDALRSKILADRQLRANSATDLSTVIKYLQGLAESQTEKLQPDAWDMVFKAVDKLHPELRSQLLSYNDDLGNKDLILLYLLKLEFKQADISRILKRPVSHQPQAQPH